MSESLLQVSGLTMRFGGLLAVDQVEFEVRKNEVFAIIGPNGAGKTTVFNCVGGFYKPTTGAIVMDGSFADVVGSELVRTIYAGTGQGDAMGDKGGHQ